MGRERGERDVLTPIVHIKVTSKKMGEYSEGSLGWTDYIYLGKDQIVAH